MNLEGETIILAPREKVWAALNDPAVLTRCIDGVEKLERVGDNRFEGSMNAKVGPVRARFTGGVELTEIDPPNGYVIVGEGKGGIAGFAKGKADLRLADGTGEGGAPGTRLSYRATSTVGGKLAQLGARLVEGAARGYAERFFASFKAEVEGPARPAAAEAEAMPVPPVPTAAADRDSEAGGGMPPAVWGALIAIGVVILVVLLIW